MQMGRHVADLIASEIHAGGQPVGDRPAFSYTDKGIMATIGRRRAIAWSGPFKAKGWVAWLAWLFIHLMTLVGFQNRLVVFVQWMWQYLTYQRGARIITKPEG
jgi:NADH dehydrogenase